MHGRESAPMLLHPEQSKRHWLIRWPVRRKTLAAKHSAMPRNGSHRWDDWENRKKWQTSPSFSLQRKFFFLRTRPYPGRWLACGYVGPGNVVWKREEKNGRIGN